MSSNESNEKDFSNEPISQISTQPILRLSLKDNKEILRFESDGNIFLKEKLIENDVEVVEGFRELLRMSGLIN